MESLNPRARSDRYGSRINRDQSPILAIGVPWLSILIGSLTPWLPIVASAPVLPPIGFLMLLAWRLLRPGLLPLWAGLPLGMFDDLFSGQPFGSATLMFALALIATELIELRFPWRTFLLDWLTASALTAVYLFVTALVSGVALAHFQPPVIVPQFLLSVMLFPIVARMVSLLDRLRLMRVRRVN